MLKRIFAAIPIQGDIKNDFIKFSERNSGVQGIRWTKPGNLHITLFFIGEVEEENFKQITRVLQNEFASIDPFTLNFSCIEVRKKKGKPVMIWASFDNTEEFSNLSRRIEESVKKFMTIEPKHKDPIPHCTLARTKPYADVDQMNLNLNKNYNLEVDSVELWMTIHEQDGVRYDRVWK